MKKFIPLFLVFALAACKSKEAPAEDEFQHEETKSPIELGQQLFESTGNCYACHQAEQKIVGPSLVEIANIYKSKNGDIVRFLKEEAEPIVDPANYAAMKVNFSITKRMSDEELRALEAYILSHAK